MATQSSTRTNYKNKAGVVFEGPHKGETKEKGNERVREIRVSEREKALEQNRCSVCRSKTIHCSRSTMIPWCPQRDPAFRGKRAGVSCDDDGGLWLGQDIANL